MARLDNKLMDWKMGTLIERLRENSPKMPTRDRFEAADEIERLGQMRTEMKKPKLTALEAEVILGMIGDVDPAHFEAWNEPERTRREKACERAKEKLHLLSR